MAVTRTAKGTITSKTSGTTLSLSAASLVVGDLFVVSLAYDDVTLTSVTVGSQTMTLQTAVLGAGVRTRLAWCVLTVSGTQTVTATFASSLVAKAMVASMYHCSTAGRVAYAGAEVNNTGNGTAASTGVSSAIVGGTDSVLVGVVGTEGPSGDTAGTWVTPATNGQRVGTTGNPAAGNVTVSEAYTIAPTANSTPALSKTGMTSRDWGAELQGFYWSLPTTTVSATFTADSILKKTIGGSGTTYVTDDFERSVTDGLGTANVGGAWTLDGTAADYDVGSGAATISVPTAGALKAPRLASVSARDIDYWAKFSLNRTASGDSPNFILLARKDSNGTSGDEYWAQVGVRTDGDFDLIVRRRVSGTASGQLASVVVTRLAAHAANNIYHLRMQCEGSTSVITRMRMWADGDTEPGTWDLSYTDNSPTTPMQNANSVGLRVDTNSGYTGTLPVVFSIYDLQVTSIGGGGGPSFAVDAVIASSGTTVSNSFSADAVLAEAGAGWIATFGTSGLVTNEYAHWSPSDPNAIKSSDWDMTSGSLFASSGDGYTGIPDHVSPNATSSNGTDSSVFRLNTKRFDWANVKVSFQAKLVGLSTQPDLPAVDWDGINIFLRYIDEDNLYLVHMDRRDNGMKIEKKVGGTYTTLASTSSNHTPSIGSFETLSATAITNPNGTVTIKGYIAGIEKISGTDDNATGGAAITQASAVGIRGDNAEFYFRDFHVEAIQSATFGADAVLAAGGATLSRTASDTVSLSGESTGRAVGAKRSSADATTTSDSAGRVLGAKRAATDTVTVAEAINAVKGGGAGAPWSFTVLAELHDTTNATSYTTPSFTYDANKLIIATVAARATSFTGDPTISGTLSWQMVNSNTGNRYVAVFAALTGGSGASGGMTVDFSAMGNAPTGCHVVIIQVDGADVSAGIANAIVQSVAAKTTNATSGTISLPSAPASANAVFALLEHPDTDPITPDTVTPPWVELSDASFSSPTSDSNTIWRTGTTSPDVGQSWVTAASAWGVVVEFKKGAGGGGGGATLSRTVGDTVSLSESAGRRTAALQALIELLHLRDTFTRTVSDGTWGISDDGARYHLSGEASSPFSVGGDIGTIVASAAGGQAAGHYRFDQTAGEPSARYDGSSSLTNVKATMRFRANKVPAGANLDVTMMVRAVDTDNRLRVGVTITTASALKAHASAEVGGTAPAILSQALASPAFAINTWFWIEAQVYGVSPTTIDIRVWQDGNARPSAPSASVVYADATVLQGPGGGGIRTEVSGSTTNLPITVDFDDFEELPLEVAPVQLTGMGRLASDTTSVSESPARRLAAGRSVSDSVSVSDAVGRVSAKLRTASDATALSDQLGRTLHAARAPPDSVATSDSIAIRFDRTRTSTDSISASDSVAARKDLRRGASDTTSVSDLITTAKTLSRSAVDTTAVSDVLNQGPTRRANDTVVTSDALAAPRVLARQPADAVVTSESSAARAGRSGVYVTAAVIRATQSSSIGLGAIVRAAQTGSTSANAIVKGAHIGSFNTGAVLLAAQGGTTSINATVQSIQLASVAFDASLVLLVQGSAVVSAILRKEASASFGASAFVLGAGTAAFGIDAIVKSTPSASPTIDAVIRKTQANSAGIDAYLLVGRTASISVDAVVFKAQSITLGLDAYISSTPSAGFTLDTVIQASQAGSGSVSAILQKTSSDTFGASAELLLLTAGSLAADAVVLATSGDSFGVSAFVQGQGVVAFNVEAVLQATATSSVDLAAVVRRSAETTLGLDAVVQTSQAGSFALDALLLLVNDGSLGVSAGILQTFDGQYGLDAAIRSAVISVSPIDAILSAAQTSTFSLDAVLRRKVVGTYAVDAYVRAVQAASFDANAVIRAQQSSTFGVSAFIGGVGVAGFDVDAVIRATQSHTSAFDAALIRLVLANVSADAVLFRKSTDQWNISAVIRSPQIGTVAISAILRGAQSGQFALDAYLNLEQRVTFTLDAVIRRQQNAGFGLAAILRDSRTDGFGLDAITSSPQVGSATFDAYIQSGGQTSFGIDAVIAGSGEFNFGADAWIALPHAHYLTAEISASTLTSAESVTALTAEIVASKLSASVSGSALTSIITATSLTSTPLLLQENTFGVAAVLGGP